MINALAGFSVCRKLYVAKSYNLTYNRQTLTGANDMQRVIIEQTDNFCFVSLGNGAAYELTNKETGETRFVQFGDDATHWRDGYESMCAAFDNPESVWHRTPWNTCLAEIFLQRLGARDMSRKNKWRRRGVLEFKRESGRYSDGTLWPGKDVLFIRIKGRACVFSILERGECWPNDGLYFRAPAVKAAKQMRRELHRQANQER